MSERDTSIKDLIDDIAENPDKVVSMNKDEIYKVYEELSKHGVIQPRKKSHIAMSIINWRDSYLRKIHTTALIGYIFRLLNEYKFDENDANFGSVTDEITKDIVNLGKKAKGSDIKECVRNGMRKYGKNCIHEFLSDSFEYNPDKHVDKAFTENLNDPERVGKFEKMKEFMKTRAETEDESVDYDKFEKYVKLVAESSESDESKYLLKHLDSAFTGMRNSTMLPFRIASELRNDLGAFNDLVKSAKNFVNEANTIDIKSNANFVEDVKSLTDVMDAVCESGAFGESSDDVKLVIKNCRSVINEFTNERKEETPDIDFNDILSLTSSKQNKIEEYIDEFAAIGVEAKAETTEVYERNPPTNLFYNFDRYLTNHYEQLREAVQILYTEKPDIEFQVQYYDTFETSEELRAFEKKYEQNFAVPVYDIENGNWTMLGPFKQNRERFDFYTKNTEVIRRMFDQAKKDTELGKDLMEKRVRRRAEENIVEAGPHDPGLKGYKEAVNTIDRLGAKQGLTNEEREKLENARREKEMAEVPSDAIQVDVFSTDDEGKMKKSHFYTEAEAPTFMEEHAEEEKKRIKSRTGSVSTIREIKDNITNDN